MRGSNSLPPPELGDLADPSRCNGPIDLQDVPEDQAHAYLKSMMRIRLAEQRLAEGRKAGEIGGPVHLGVGQEAIPVGISAALRPTDRVFSAHRSHGHLLALGSSVHGLFAEVLGKETGLSRGMGGSMHLIDQEHGFFGSVPIVGGTVPLAVGAGLAAAMQGTRDIAVSYFGDGAIEEGVVHESLNLARMLNAPVVFVCENNLFASHMHISQRQPDAATARFAQANDMRFRIVDGNDVAEVGRAAQDLVERARAGEGPSYLEAVTYRWYGHVDWREDIDVGVQRSRLDVDEWRARDPLLRLRTAMQLAGWLDESEAHGLEEALREETTAAWKQAVNDPFPDQSSLLSRVYAS